MVYMYAGKVSVSHVVYYQFNEIRDITNFKDKPVY